MSWLMAHVKGFFDPIYILYGHSGRGFLRNVFIGAQELGKFKNFKLKSPLNFLKLNVLFGTILIFHQHTFVACMMSVRK